MRTPVPPAHLLRTTLAGALYEIYSADAHLFEAEAGERAVVHKLGVRLLGAVESWRAGWTVDAEYNRMSPTKTYPNAAFKYLLDVLGEEVKPAYPDLIVHRPGVDGPAGGNLLVIEAKRSPTDKQRRRDHAKLVAWCCELHYVHGVRLELAVHGPRWSWVDKDADQRSVIDAELVFDSTSS